MSVSTGSSPFKVSNDFSLERKKTFENILTALQLAIPIMLKIIKTPKVKRVIEVWPFYLWPITNYSSTVMIISSQCYGLRLTDIVSMIISSNPATVRRK